MSDYDEQAKIKIFVNGVPRSGKSTLVYVIRQTLQDMGMMVEAFDSEPIDGQANIIHLKKEAMRNRKVQIYVMDIQEESLTIQPDETKEQLIERIRQAKRGV